MKKCIAIWTILMILISGMCLAEAYNMSDMTTAQLKSLKIEIDSYIEADHEATSSEKSRIKSAVQEYINNYYGEDNVSWAWIDYSYTKEWDYFTIETHADVKKGHEEVRCDILADVFRTGDAYHLTFVQVGNDVLIDERSAIIDDQRVLKMLGISAEDTNQASEEVLEATPSNDEAQAAEPVSEGAKNAVTDATIAKRGDRNDTVKEIQSMLIRLTLLKGKADGDYGGKTETAIKEFQHAHGLEETGIVTESVFNALETAVANLPEPVSYDSYSAIEIYEDYESNEIAANAKYKGKIVVVTGKVEGVKTTLFGTPYVEMKADKYGFKLLDFTFSESALDQLAMLREDQTVTIQAKCTGWSVLSVDFSDSKLIE